MIQCMHELRVLDPSKGQPNARIEEGGVNPVGIHVGDAGVRVEAALAAFLVGHRVVANYPVTGADGTERSEASAPAKGLAIDAQTLLAVIVDKQARRPIPKVRFDVILPQIQRLED